MSSGMGLSTLGFEQFKSNQKNSKHDLFSEFEIKLTILLISLIRWSRGIWVKFVIYSILYQCFNHKNHISLTMREHVLSTTISIRTITQYSPEYFLCFRVLLNLQYISISFKHMIPTWIHLVWGRGNVYPSWVCGVIVKIFARVSGGGGLEYEGDVQVPTWQWRCQGLSGWVARPPGEPNWGRIEEKWGNVPLLPTRGWESGYAPATWERT